MPICSFVVQTKPEHAKAVSGKLNDMDGVEVHAQNEHGKMVVTIDRPNREYCGSVVISMTQISGVMSASLVYEYQEELENQLPTENQIA
jgi:nitrate reductase NapD